MRGGGLLLRHDQRAHVRPSPHTGRRTERTDPAPRLQHENGQELAGLAVDVIATPGKRGMMRLAQRMRVQCIRLLGFSFLGIEIDALGRVPFLKLGSLSKDHRHPVFRVQATYLFDPDSDPNFGLDYPTNTLTTSLRGLTPPKRKRAVSGDEN